MSLLQDISERLLVRSQEAILQLDVWIQRQRRLQELMEGEEEQEQGGDTNTNMDIRGTLPQFLEQYNTYMAQLNSLQVRVEFIRDTLVNKKNTGIRNQQLESNNSVDEQKYIQDLVHEFQDITQKLSELSTVRNPSTASSRSTSTKSSIESFKPKPLRIISRSNTHSHLHQQTSLDKKVSFNEDESNSSISHSRSMESLHENSKSLRNTKSMDVLKRSTFKNHSDFSKLLNSRQRLSINIFDDDLIANEDGNEFYNQYSDSDQATVISHGTPIRGADTPLLRRYNSHESILSFRKPTQSRQPNQILPYSSVRQPSMQSVAVNSNPIFSRMRPNATSKDLLSSFINKPQPNRLHQQKPKPNSNSLFGKWNFFNKFNSVTSEIGTTTTQLYPTNSSMSNKFNPNDIPSSASIREPVFDDSLHLEDLNDALNTELLL
ncbi:hypothetical protein NCAS_0B09120 [Naumovozyma castellii]|uniref:Uncharacterized protein n=1 Tax=Naumovozyma castellii TaxID=27288 RepID=G0VAW8_NAUCA|nr:hypothetical protein NCAS_0B09120 [Naumovozyma castellii CBS 4309]CCC68996.1 hypothetical protein NCAS_0B09120 [Naumovozyma castellii CBS 4309]